MGVILEMTLKPFFSAWDKKISIEGKKGRVRAGVLSHYPLRGFGCHSPAGSYMPWLQFGLKICSILFRVVHGRI